MGVLGVRTATYEFVKRGDTVQAISDCSICVAVEVVEGGIALHGGPSAVFHSFCLSIIPDAAFASQGGCLGEGWREDTVSRGHPWSKSGAQGLRSGIPNQPASSELNSRFCQHRMYVVPPSG